MIEALAALSDSAGRMSAEPIAARRGLKEMAALLIAAHGLIAQISAARLDREAGGTGPDPMIRGWLLASLPGRRPLAEAEADAPAGPLVATALVVLKAAGNYKRAAEDAIEARPSA